MFWNWFRGKSAEQGSSGPPLAPLVTDMHSHLIPGIDDGAQTMEQSLELVRDLVALGYRKLITTPHVMSDSYRNTPEKILGGLEKLRQAVKAEGIEVELAAAAEYYLDEDFEDKVGTAEFLTFGGDKKYLLLETSYVSRPLSLEKVVFNLQTAGYKPVFAHPERYNYFWDIDYMTAIRDLKERGMLMQVNVSSLSGSYSKRSAMIASDLIKEGMVDFLGTDLHRKSQVERLRETVRKQRDLQELIQSGTLLNANL